MDSIRLSDLKPWDRNYNQGDVGAIYTSIAAFGFNGTLRVWRDGVVIAGNHALKALQGMRQAGELPPEHIAVDADGEWLVPVTDVTHLDRMQAQAFAIADNRTRDLATSDDAMLAALLQEVVNTDAALLAATGYDGDDLDVMMGGLAVDPVYSHEITPPTYEPAERCPEVSELRDDERCRELAREIATASIDEGVREFLLAAAQRHVVFDYQLIADFYSHAPAEVQRLMERSALVVIDLDSAIAEGYVNACSVILEARAGETP